MTGERVGQEMEENDAESNVFSIFWSTWRSRLIFICQSKALLTTACNINVNMEARIVANVDLSALLGPGSVHSM